MCFHLLFSCLDVSFTLSIIVTFENRNDALRNRNKLRQIKERFSLKEEVGKSQLAQAKHLLDTYIVLPVVEPITNEVSRRANKVRKKVRRGLRQIVEVATIRTRKLYLKFNGHFDEVQRELKYEIYRQYVDHHVAEAKEKAKHEFAVIESGTRIWLHYCFHC